MNVPQTFIFIFKKPKFFESGLEVGMLFYWKLTKLGYLFSENAEV